MKNSLHKLYQGLANIDFMNVSEVNHSQEEYYRYSNSSVFSSVCENCIIMRETDGCAINLKNIDEHTKLYSSTFIWFFLGDIIHLERYTKKGLEHLCTLHEVDGKLVQQETKDSPYLADICVIGNQVEIMIVKENNEVMSETMCLSFSKKISSTMVSLSS